MLRCERSECLSSAAHAFYLLPGPYITKHRSSNALTICLDTCPKNAADTVACTGFANANDRSRVNSVGPEWSAEIRWCDVDGEDEADKLGADVFWGGGRPLVLGCGDRGEAGWKRHVVVSVLNSGVDDDATASTDSYGRHVTLLT